MDTPWKHLAIYKNHRIIYRDDHERRIYNLILISDDLPTKNHGGYFSLMAICNLKGYSVWEIKEFLQKEKLEV